MSEKERYTDEELEEFRQLILDKLAKARELYDELTEGLKSDYGNGTADTANAFKILEEAADMNERETNARLAERQRKFIGNLEAALKRIDNKTYGISRISGKLIPKDRLRAVPHATTCLEEKLAENR